MQVTTVFTQLSDGTKPTYFLAERDPPKSLTLLEVTEAFDSRCIIWLWNNQKLIIFYDKPLTELRIKYDGKECLVSNHQDGTTMINMLSSLLPPNLMVLDVCDIVRFVYDLGVDKSELNNFKQLIGKDGHNLPLTEDD